VITPQPGTSPLTTAMKGAEAIVLSVSLAQRTFFVSLQNRSRATGTEQFNVNYDDCIFLDHPFVVPSNITVAPSRVPTLPRVPLPPTPLVGGSTPAWTSTPDPSLVGGPWVPDAEDNAVPMGKPISTAITYICSLSTDNQSKILLDPLFQDKLNKAPYRSKPSDRPCPLVCETEAPHEVFEVLPIVGQDLPLDHLPLSTFNRELVPSRHYAQLRLAKVQKKGDLAVITAKGSGKFGWLVELAEDAADRSVQVWQYKRKGKMYSISLDCLCRCHVREVKA
jgi:hypothetical protein